LKALEDGDPMPRVHALVGYGIGKGFRTNMPYIWKVIATSLIQSSSAER
jgi:hypothetical protein